LTVSVTHAKVSGKPTGNDPERVYGTHWDADHTVPVATAEQVAALTSEDVLITPAGLAGYSEHLAGVVLGTRAVLQTITVPVAILAVYTTGYTDPGDGGGALHKRVLAEPAHDGWFQDISGAYFELAEPAPTPLMFGAIADGDTDETDNSDALQSWLDFGGELRISGHFAHNSTLTITEDGAHITGKEAKLSYLATTKTRQLRVRVNSSDNSADSPVNDVTIDGVEFDYRRDEKGHPFGDTTSYTQGVAILFTGSRNTLKNCIIRNTIEHGVTFSLTPVSDDDVIDKPTVQNCRFYDIGNSASGRGLAVWMFGNVRNALITGNHVDSTCIGGLGVDEGSSGTVDYDRYFYNAVIADNVVESANIGIRYEGALGASITGNKVSNWYNDDRTFTTHSGICARTISQNDHFPSAGEVTITGNTVDSEIICIEMQNLRDAVVTGNVLSYRGGTAVGDGEDVAEKGAVTYYANNYVIADFDAINETGTTFDPSATTGSITITASAITGINGGAGFRTEDVGRYVKLVYSGDRYRAIITAYNSTTNVDATVIDTLPAHTAITTWALGDPARGANILVANNTIDTTERGIHFGDITSSYTSFGVPGVAIRGNTITYKGDTAAVSGMDGIHINRCAGAAVSDNIIRGGFYDGITTGTDDVTYLAIRDNDIVGALRYGIQLSGTGGYHVVGNTSRDAVTGDIRVEAAANIAATVFGDNVFTTTSGTYSTATQLSRNGGMVATNPDIIYQSAVGVSHTGDTNETALRTIAITGMGANGSLRITTVWTTNDDASSKTGRVRLGGIGGTVFFATNQASVAGYTAQHLIANRNATNSQLGRPLGSGTGVTGSGWAGGSTAVVTGAIDTSVSVDLVITAQLADAADTMTLEYVLVELLRAS
jgi:hypothetical protein